MKQETIKAERYRRNAGPPAILRRRRQAGQSLLEVLIGLSIGAIIIGSAVFVIAGMLRSTSVTKQNYSASVVTQDLMERARTYFGLSWINFSGVTSTQTFHYFLNASGTTLIAVEGEEGVWDNDVVNGLAGQWKMDESPTAGSPSVFDGSGKQNTGILEKGISAPTVPQRVSTSTCRVSNCLQFNGNQQGGGANLGNWVRVPYASGFDFSGNVLSLSAWVRPNANPVAGQYGGILRHGATAAGYRLMHNSSGGVTFQIGNVSAYTLASQKTLPLNQWTYVVATLQSGTMSLYLNGVLDSQLADPANLLTTAEDLYIGVSHTDYSSFNGQMDDVRVYNRGLSEDEITRLTKSNAFRRYFYVNDTCRTNDAASTIIGPGPACAGILDPATKAISAVTEWPAGPRWSQYVFTDYLTRWQNNVFWQNDWSGGPGSVDPVFQPDDRFASSSNLDYASGSLHIRNF